MNVSDTVSLSGTDLGCLVVHTCGRYARRDGVRVTKTRFVVYELDI